MRPLLLIISLSSLFTYFFRPGFSQEKGTVTDIDGNIYSTVLLGTKWWMTENLHTTKYSSGAAIPYSDGTKTLSANDYQDYFKFPDNNEAHVTSYGLLYSWGVIANASASVMKDICPEGWSVPDTTDWKELAEFLGGKSLAGGKLKSTSDAWQAPNAGAGNESGLNILPAGDCNTSGFSLFGREARFWTPQMVTPGNAGRIYMALTFDSPELKKGQYRNVNTLSIRCIKPLTTSAEGLKYEGDFRMYGPYQGFLSLKGLEGYEKISIYTTNGSLVAQYELIGEISREWNIDTLPSGIYLLRVEGKRVSETRKFIKN